LIWDDREVVPTNFGRFAVALADAPVRFYIFVAAHGWFSSLPLTPYQSQAIAGNERNEKGVFFRVLRFHGLQRKRAYVSIFFPYRGNGKAKRGNTGRYLPGCFPLHLAPCFFNFPIL